MMKSENDHYLYLIIGIVSRDFIDLMPLQYVLESGLSQDLENCVILEKIIITVGRRFP